MALGNQIGKRIKELREEAGLTQSQLALNVGTTKNTISRLELGERNPSIRTIEEIAKSLGVEPSELFKFPEPAGKA